MKAQCKPQTIDTYVRHKSYICYKYFIYSSQSLPINVFLQNNLKIISYPKNILLLTYSHGWAYKGLREILFYNYIQRP